MGWLAKLGFKSRSKGAGEHTRPLPELEAEFARFAPYRVAARLEGLTATTHPDVERPLFAAWRRALPERLGAAQRSTFELAREAIALSRSLLVTQRQIDLDIRDSFEDGLLEESMTILTSGLANCEMANYIVWMALADTGRAVYPFETGDIETVEGSHLLLYVVDESGAAFVDAWSDIPMIHVEDFVPRTFDVKGRANRSRIQALAKLRPPGIPTHAELGPGVTRERHGLYPESCFREGSLRSSFDNIDPDWELVVNDPEPSDPSTTPQVWRDYVQLRSLHVHGKLSEPITGYEAFARRDDLDGRLRAVVEALAARQG